jgi:hypothetical protein
MQFAAAVLLLLLSNVSFASPSKSIVAGTVQEFEGNPEVLRNPVSKPSQQWRDSVAQRGYVVASYEGRFWESHQIAKGMKLHYGDRISSTGSKQIIIQFDDGMQLMVAADSVVKLSRTLIKQQNQTFTQRWVSLISGTIRAKAEQSSESNRRTKFRSGSIAMGVRGTEFVVENRRGNTKLVTLEGEVSVREITPRESELFEALTDRLDAGSVNSQEVERLQAQLSEATKSSGEVAVTPGMKIEVPNAPPPSMALTDQPAAPLKLQPTPVTKDDDATLQSVQAQSIASSETPTTPTKDSTAGQRHLVAAALANAGIRFSIPNGQELEVDGPGLALEYRWNFHRFMDIGAFLAQFSPPKGDDLSPILTRASAGRIDQSMRIGGLRFGGRYDFGNFGLGMGISLSRLSNVVIAFDSPTGTQTVTLETVIHPMLSIAASYRISSDWLVLMELAGTGISFERVDSNPALALNRDDEHGFNWTRLGVGYNF